MDTGLVIHTVLGLLLLLIPAGALYLLERQMLKSFGLAVGRMMVQLLAVCLMVWGLIRFDRAWLSGAWLLAMAALSAFWVQRRCKSVPLVTVAAGLFLGVIVVGLWLLGAVFPVRAFAARWFVPVMALLVGHTMTALIRGLSTYESALRTDRQQYEYLRGNGINHLHALWPFVRRALQQIFAPTAANLAVMGLYAMPLLLCGIFIAGVAPINAFVVTLQLIFGCLAASVIALVVTLWLADRQLFA
jgi:putative ABC transport system permease protein